MFDIDFIEQALKIAPEIAGTPKNKEVSGFAIDSRETSEGQCFVGIKGEKADGNLFAPELSLKGVEAFILSSAVREEVMPSIKNGYVFFVEDTVKALAVLALRHKTRLFSTMVAVTGSSGKTTTRHLITAVLSRKFKVHTAKKNLNTDIGLPLSMLDAPLDTRVMVMEMGMNHPGEIGRLSRIGEPLLGVITNIGYAHIGLLGSLEAIADAKSEIYYGLNKRGFIFLNRDDPFYGYLRQKSPVDVVDFSAKDVRVLENRALDGYRLSYKDETFDFALPGEHNLSNLAAAIRIGEFFQVDTADIAAALSGFKPVEGRSHILRGAKWTVINDCYNSNPSSAMAALKMLSSAPGHRVAVLSDMLELGDQAGELHRMIGEFIVGNQCCETVVGYGEYTKELIDIVDRSGITAKWFESLEALQKHLKDYVSQGDTILVKSSHGMKLDSVVRLLEKN